MTAVGHPQYFPYMTLLSPDSTFTADANDLLSRSGMLDLRVTREATPFPPTPLPHFLAFSIRQLRLAGDESLTTVSPLPRV